jgi:hypothetical protein
LPHFQNTPPQIALSTVQLNDTNLLSNGISVIRNSQ